MNSALLTLGAVVVLVLGYYLYGRLVERRCVQADEDRPTPAVALRDGVDYEPARSLMLFGHHFTNIAGAGPIVGPVIAVAYFGWAATLGWILLGSIFVGGVHDYLSLMMSARSEGKNISEIAGRLVGKRAAAVLGLFIWLALLLVIAMFGILAAQTLIEVPAVVVPNAGLIVVAVFIGLAVYRWRQPLWVATVLGVAAMGALLYAGERWPLVWPEGWGSPFVFWFLALMAYSLLTSVLPIWFLEQPRDYLSSMITYGGILVGVVALFAAQAPVATPAHVGFSSTQGPLWPMLFIIVACGAVSGFHSLVAGGTTVKQLANEKQGLPIAYGGMMLEGVQAASVTFLVAAGLYWLGRHVGPDGKSLVVGELMNAPQGGGPAVVFVRGFASLASRGLPFISFSTGLLIAAICLNATLLDTLDTCARLGRFVLSETFGSRLPALANRWLAALVTVGAAGYLGLSGMGKSLWPVFGAANQLIAALALLIVAVYLVGIRRPSLYATLPGLFVLVTTVAALLYQGYGFLLGPKRNLLLGLLSVLLVVLGLYVAVEAWDRIRALTGPRVSALGARESAEE